MQRIENPPGITDNDVLDQWRIPFGDWYDQAVDWIDVTFNDQLKTTEGVFAWFIDRVIDDVLLAVPWIVVVIVFFLLGWLLQNIKIGIFAGIALTVCGLMGATYWLETMLTVGYITVAVVLCCIIGIPIGIVSGRIDSFWQAVRPMLDAMQVVHSFIYMLPFIYFFGIGPVSATIVTMVFALPPVIRLTNLGIRSVPEDVVEASRAFGQSELRILRDVQLPLARPAIMTGINQTLLLAISMLGIAALMGAGGLGRRMFQALNNQDPALSGSAGLAFFLVAVVLDRLTQRDGDASASLWYRLRRAWSLRAEPEQLMAEIDDLENQQKRDEEDLHAVRYEPIASAEHPGMGLLFAGSILTAISLFLSWNSGAGWFSSFTRRLDEFGVAEAGTRKAGGDITGEAFNGLEASGASWFGYMLVLGIIFSIACVVSMAIRPGRGSRWLNPDGAVVGGLSMLILMAVYVLSSISANGVAESGIGPIIALVGTGSMAVGSLMWALAAKQEPLRPLPEKRLTAPIVASFIALALIFGGGFSAWVFDERTDAVISAEVQAELDALIAEARDPETSVSRATAISVEIAVVRAEAANNDKVITSGFSEAGPQSSIWLNIIGGAGILATLVAAGALSLNTRRQWIAGAVVMGLGAGIVVFTAGYVGTLARATDPNVVSGVGVFLSMIGGVVLASAGRSVINEFRRSRVYPDITDITDDVGGARSTLADDVAEAELVGAAGN